MAAQTMPAISIDINMFWQIINFFILVVVFNKFFKKPLAKILKERREQISGDLEEAKKDREIANSEIEKAKIILREAKDEAHEIITTAEKKADERREEIIKSATFQRDKMLKSAEIEVVKMKERARKEVKEEMQKLAIQLAEKIINEKLDSKKGSALVDNFIDEMGEL